jgi:transposase-like protein
MRKREHRRFTAEQKLEILREADQPGVSVSEVCRRHGLAASVFYRWPAVAQGGSEVALKRDAQRTPRKEDPEARAQGGNGADARGDRGNHGGKPGAKKKDLKLENLFRVRAQTKAAVMQIVDQTKRRSGWRVYRTLAALGVPRSVYYAWKTRENLEDRRSARRSATLPCNIRRSAIAYLDDGRCRNGLRRGEHGLPGFERCGPVVALEAINDLERGSSKRACAANSCGPCAS